MKKMYFLNDVRMMLEKMFSFSYFIEIHIISHLYWATYSINNIWQDVSTIKVILYMRK